MKEKPDGDFYKQKKALLPSGISGEIGHFNGLDDTGHSLNGCTSWFILITLYPPRERYRSVKA
jgi:hypothetical protein